MNIYSLIRIYPMNGIKLPMNGIETLCIFIDNNIQRVIMILQKKTFYFSSNRGCIELEIS